MSFTDMFSNNDTSKIYGVVTAIVTNNQDPDKLGRVKVKFPWLSAKDESNWARVASWMAGPAKGAFILPEVEDEVLVAFEHGDIARPYIMGSLWNGKDLPPEDNSNGENNIKRIQSRSGLTIDMDDKQGEEKILICDKEKKFKIEMSIKDKKISIISDKDIEYKAPQGKISLEAKEIIMTSTADTKMEASGNVVIKGTKIEMN
ncbi:phage baseplate assembly protein V [Candidatus Uabimicrobium sp. HlEnr_7]|uniref:phage baseplate assembly protein V n=1 Tax=Candidatus Uabimicrobium helgolandensis TaxID=3095367 RepID=UPI003557DF07